MPLQHSLSLSLCDTHLGCAFVRRARTHRYITSLIQLIEQQLAEEGEGGTGGGKEQSMRARSHFEATKAYIALKKTTDERFVEIEA